MRVGVISDTHGVVLSAVHEAFAGVNHILHAGDIGDQIVLDELELIAPVVAVRGNTDTGPLVHSLPARHSIAFAGVRFLIGHILPELVRGGVPDDVDVVVYGHTHVAAAREIDGAWYVNPGSASQPRDGFPPSVAIVEITGDRYTVHHTCL